MPYKDPEKQREADRRWRAANLEKARAREAAYRAANRECEFRRNPAGDSDLKPATVPI